MPISPNPYPPIRHVDEVAPPSKHPSKQATPERWQLALRRAQKEGVTVRQVNESGQWIAMSPKSESAYELTVVNGIIQGCSCPAVSDFGDRVCKHMAQLWSDFGMLGLYEEGQEDQ